VSRELTGNSFEHMDVAGYCSSINSILIKVTTLPKNTLGWMKNHPYFIQGVTRRPVKTVTQAFSPGNNWAENGSITNKTYTSRNTSNTSGVNSI
jgi:hypothetical protein